MRKALLILLATATALLSQNTSFFFLQFSDPQFGMYEKNAGFSQEQANLDFAIATANRLKPKFVIISGDLVNRAGDTAQIDALKAGLARLNPDIKLYLIAGNHDVGNEPTPVSLAAYRSRFGSDYYTFDAGPLRGIVLNSSLIASPAKAAEDNRTQERWFQKELERAQSEHVKHIVIFQHHPYFTKVADEADGYFNIPLTTRKPYLELCRKYGVEHIFAGHLHQNALAHDGNIQMITTGPVGMPLGTARSGIRVVTVGDTLQHQFYELSALPNRIDAGEPLSAPK
jgi:3',5'-cyclic AMP phosphodiesterase CpdA